MKLTKIKSFLSTRLGFMSLLVFLFWLKTLFGYFTDFNLAASGFLQIAILIFNPVATTLLLFGIILYVRQPHLSYWLSLIIYAANTALLYFNVIYYRQFTDYMTINTILGYSKVSAGLSKSSLALMNWHDALYWIDIIVLALLILTKVIKIDKHAFNRRWAFSITSLAVLLFGINLGLSEISRPQILSRTFDRNYIVKYLGIDTFTVYDAFKTTQNNQVRAQAESYDLDPVLDFMKEHYAAPNAEYAGVAKGKNVIVIHLESFQQFLIDFKFEGREVTPFLNSLYHDQNTLGFENFFHQVGQGKTSDAENMMETGVYGLPQGSVFTTLGSDNTFQAAPSILKQNGDYTSAVFHGNVGTFWNRNNVYKNFGYNYFFDSSYFNTDPDNVLQYGLKDKLLFGESIKYLEQLQQPFYTKFITVTNHFPFPLPEKDGDFPRATTDNTAVNNYFATAHYLDQSLEEFFNYLKASGLYDNSMIVLYGDHYGLSNSDNKALLSVLGRDPETWTDYDNAQLQRVPYMIHMNGLKGGIQKQYGGEIDALPTMLHLLGIDNKNYVQFGTDLLSPQHDQVVAFRNHNFVTPDYTVLDGTIYNNQDGTEVTEPTAKLQKQVAVWQKQVNRELSLSDSVNEKNLLRFYTPQGFKPVNPADCNYLTGYQQLVDIQNKLGANSTSLFSQNGDQSTVGLFKTDAPELADDQSSLTEVPKSKALKKESDATATNDAE
ncbi:LTA synthase family protein [Latilactobacillus curvatus]|nr:LTA synthase family protein [Latilactobacillus curvatus]MCM6861234.1 LTA synthase family protein [Latilactobacillus curvatus]MCM6868532.1 LTA synthase family protein [Latilactobacillus curvatus]MDG2983874.1 LTA synthase family protein [Latilactobacillus curvatus]UTB70662.1 alkaline phosphatase [Latilactobacillus curvatus]